MRSKAHWGYSKSFLAACADELHLAPAAIESGLAWRVAVEDGHVVGLYGLERCDRDRVELAALFVEPGRIGSGIGRHLVADAVRVAGRLGYEHIIIQGDPNAEGFYLAMGATQTGYRESGSIPGRSLPLFEIRVGPERAGPGDPDRDAGDRHEHKTG